MPPRPSKTPSRISRLSLVAVLVLLVVLGVVATHRQALYDWARLQGYQPPATVSTLATQDTMTPLARHIFYVNHPGTDDKSTFATKCPSGSREQTIVLGCYHSDQAGIFLLNVDDPRLNGVMQVTAAHEMLHAAYDRLSAAERNQINQMLLDYYNHALSDQRIKDTIQAYRQTEPNDLVNEMHSIFGTEIANLPPALEQYYSRYFTNRSQIAAYAAQYKAVFTSRQTTVANDDTQLSAWKSQIQNLEADLRARQTEISSEHNNLLADRASGNINAYNAGVPAYNRLIDNYNAEVSEVQSLVAQYNQLVNERNTIALQEDQLVNELQANVGTINQ